MALKTRPYQLLCPKSRKWPWFRQMFGLLENKPLVKGESCQKEGNVEKKTSTKILGKIKHNSMRQEHVDSKDCQGFLPEKWKHLLLVAFTLTVSSHLSISSHHRMELRIQLRGSGLKYFWRWFQLWFSPSVFVTTAWLHLMSDRFHVYQGEVWRTGALYFARGLPVSRSNSLVASCWSNVRLFVGENWGLTKSCFIMVCWSFMKVLWILQVTMWKFQVCSFDVGLSRRFHIAQFDAHQFSSKRKSV